MSIKSPTSARSKLTYHPDHQYSLSRIEQLGSLDIDLDSPQEAVIPRIKLCRNIEEDLICNNNNTTNMKERESCISPIPKYEPITKDWPEPEPAAAVSILKCSVRTENDIKNSIHVGNE